MKREAVFCIIELMKSTKHTYCPLTKFPQRSVTGIFCFLFLLVISAADLTAQSLPADRPGLGFTSGLTEKGDLILESGTTLRSGSATIGEFYLKTGVHKTLELQFHTGSLLWNTTAGSTNRSTPAFLAKYQPDLDLPEEMGLTLLARTLLPVLDPNTSSWLTQVLVLADYQFTDVFSLSVNAGYGDFVNDIGDGTFTFTTNPGLIISPQLSVYTGYGWFGDANSSYTVIEGGATYLIQSRMQLDAGFRFDSNETAYLTAGLIVGF